MREEPRMEERLGATSLMYACQQGREQNVRQIINSKEVSLEERERSGKTALHYCAESNGGVGCAAALLASAPALLDAPDQDGYTPLHLAVIAGNLPLIHLLLSKGAQVNAVDNEGHTAVHWATVCGEIESLEAVLEGGGEAGLADMHGGRPLHYAAQMCGPGSEMPADTRLGLAALKILLARGADPDPPDNHGRQPLLWAASAGSSDAILALVNAGANVEAADKDGLTALHCAASRGHTECVENLISLCGAGVDVIDSNGCSALFYAVTLGHADATQLLLNHEANTNRQDRKGRTAVHCGAAKGQLETLKVVSACGGNLWQRTVRGDYPLHDAVASGRRTLVLWLLEQRPDAVNAPNNDGRSPLHVAAIHNNVEMCKTLLDMGSLVNPVMRTSKGELATPLDAALHKGYRGCAKYLQLHGGVPATRLNSHSAALRGPTDKLDVSGVEHSTEEKTASAKEAETIDKTAISVSTHKELTMMTPKAKILEVYVEDEVEIRRIRYRHSSDSSIEERTRHRRRKRRSKHGSGRDNEKSDKNRKSRRRKQQVTSEEESKSESDIGGMSEKNHKTRRRKSRNGEVKLNDEKIAGSIAQEIILEKDHYDGKEEVEQEELIISDEVIKDESGTKEAEEEEKVPEEEILVTDVDNEDKEDQSNAMNEGSDKIEENNISLEKDTIELSQDEGEITTQVVTAIVHNNPENSDNTVSIEKDDLIEENEDKDSKSQEICDTSVADVGDGLIVEGDEPELNEEESPDKSESPNLVAPEQTQDEDIGMGGGEEEEEQQEEVPNVELVETDIQGVVEVEEETQEMAEENVEAISAQEIEKDEEIADEKIEEEKDIPADEDHVGEEIKVIDPELNEEIGELVPNRITTEDEPEESQIKISDSELKDSQAETGSEEEKSQEIEKSDEDQEDQASPESGLLEEDIIVDKTEGESEMVQDIGDSDILADDSPTNEIDSQENKTQHEEALSISKSNTLDINDDEIANILINNNKGLVKVLDEGKVTKTDHLKVSSREEKRRRVKKKRESSAKGRKKERASESFEILSSILDEDIESEVTRSPTGDSSQLPDSGIEPSPRRETSSVRSGKDSRIPRPCRKGSSRSQGSRAELSTVSVTQAVQFSMRKYHLERRIFHELLELKRLQIRSGRASEAVLVKRLVDDYRRAGLMLGLQQYSGVYTFRAFEKYLYEQLRLLQSSERRIIPRLKSSDDLDRLTAALKKTKVGQDILTSVPNNPIFCTHGTHRCHHATHAYTGVPCAAYISRPNHHAMSKSASSVSFLPKLVNDENHAEVARTLRYVDPSRPLTLELNHGSDKQVISLPTDKLDKNKRYFVTFTIKGGENQASGGRHTHASSF